MGGEEGEVGGEREEMSCVREVVNEREGDSERATDERHGEKAERPFSTPLIPVSDAPTYVPISHSARQSPVAVRLWVD